MNFTPQSNRLHVCIFGETNSGKSALFNAITGSDNSIVSPVSGTTTDAVQKSMELLPFGPIVLVDTAGLNDSTVLGKHRLEKTNKLLERTDFAIYTIDPEDFKEQEYNKFKAKLNSKNIPHLVVFTKNDNEETIDLNLQHKFEDALSVSILRSESINKLKYKLAERLSSLAEDSKSLIGGLLAPGSTVILVIPIDSAAPKGRVILPQVQFIRDCLDNSIICHITTEKQLSAALANAKNIDLVVTDSQVFSLVSEIVPDNILLTSFSVLMARCKGDIRSLLDGIDAIKNLKNNDKVLISEVCTHNRTHEDIGHVKIPNALRKTAKCDLQFDFSHGRDYPENLEQYALVVHCGGCMITQREMEYRITFAQQKHVPITNYGLVLAYSSGILERSIQILN